MSLVERLDHLADVHSDNHPMTAGMVREAAARIRQLEAKYMELIMAVEKKWPNETRHQTALRYILEREAQNTDMGGKESK